MKALIFLRHYNDIDHITPVIYKWAESGHHADIILLGNSKLSRDYRIEFLRGCKNMRVSHIKKLLPFIVFVQWRLQMLLVNSKLRHLSIAPLANKVTNIIDAKRREPLWRSTSKRLLDWSFQNQSKGVVVFDWITRNSPVSLEWVEIILSNARSMNLGAVSLPHGDSPHFSQLIRHGEWSLKPDTMYSAARIFNRLVVPNELCAKRFRPFMVDHSLAVLGSPRYCDEWLTKLNELPLPAPPDLKRGLLNIVIFLRKNDFTIFWEEIGEVVHMLASFPGVELVIKPHTRGGWRQPLTRDRSLRQLPNVKIVGGDVHSIHLINWADVMIDIATSVVFEAVKAKKPVLAGDYLHAGRSTIAEYMPETELRCRDDIYHRINEFLTKGCDGFYIEAHRQRFIKEIIDGRNADVLPRYVALLEQQSQQGITTDQNRPI